MNYRKAEKCKNSFKELQKSTILRSMRKYLIAISVFRRWFFKNIAYECGNGFLNFSSSFVSDIGEIFHKYI